MLTEADTGQTQAKTKEQQEAEFKSALEAAKASGMPQEEIDRITKERELQKALENPVQFDPKNDPIAKSEKERTMPSMGAISDAESKIGHAMAVGDAMRKAEATGKVPVGTYPNQVEEIIYNNLKDFMINKDKNDQIFDKITATDLNSYLDDLMEGLTAKVFRTYNASQLMSEELQKIMKKYENIQ